MDLWDVCKMTDEKFTGKLKSLTECMQQHEPTDWKIGQSADCMLWCGVANRFVCACVRACVCVLEERKPKNNIQKHNTTLTSTSADTDTVYTNTHWLVPLQKARMKKSLNISFILLHIQHNHSVCLFVCLSVGEMYVCTHKPLYAKANK